MAETTRKYTDETIEPFRMVSDELADAAFIELKKLKFSSTQRDVFDFMKEHLENEAFAAIVAQTDRVPHWVDFQKIERGRHLYLRHAPLGGFVLLAGGLIASYTAQKGVKVLVRTGRLKDTIVPRLQETGNFMHAVLQKDALTPGFDGHRTALKVRMMHAGVRDYILNTRDDWNFEWGHPINQEDMLGTLTAFSYALVDGLEKMGIYIAPDEKEAFHHLWRYVGYLLGMDEFFLPATFAEGQELCAAVKRRQCHPDQDSRTLVHAVLDTMDEFYDSALPTGSLVELTRFILGDKLANELELPQHKFWNMTYSYLSPFWRAATYAGSKFWPWQKAAPHLGNLYMRYVVHGRGDKQHFAYPIPGLA